MNPRPMTLAEISAAIDELVRACHQNSRNKGFWDGQDPILAGPIKIALMHSELSEALEELRVQIYRPEDSAGERRAVELVRNYRLAEEFSDVLIRIFDYCGAAGLDLGSALIEKMAKNRERPYMHGKNF